MKRPYLRPAPPEGTPSAPCPLGWTAVPAGRWRRGAVEVVFHPSAHKVVFLRAGSAPTRAALARAGFSCWGRDGTSEMWVAGVSQRRAGPSRRSAGPRRTSPRG